VQIKQVK